LMHRRGAPRPRRAAPRYAAVAAEVCAFLAALPPSVAVPELTLLPAALQALGRTT